MKQHGSAGGKSLPPFGRVLTAYQQESILLDHYITVYVGKHAKNLALADKRSGVSQCTFLPHGEDFAKYLWPIKGQKVIVQDTGSMELVELKSFCFHLMTHYEPRVIYLYSEQHPNELILPQGVMRND